jgi:hypothetical protein
MRNNIAKAKPDTSSATNHEPQTQKILPQSILTLEADIDF